MLKLRFGPTTSILILLGLVLITTGVWYAAYKAQVIAEGLSGHVSVEQMN